MEFLEIAAHYGLALGVLLAAYFIRGMTGFGSGLIAVPLLAFSYPLQVIVPLVLSLDFIASFILGGVAGKKASWTEITMLLPFGSIGALLGVFALMRFPASPILVALGVFAVYFGLRNIRGVEAQGVISPLWALPTGLVGSGAGALFGTSAPPYIIYLTHRLHDKAEVRATFSWLFVLDGGFRLFLFLAAGLLLKQETQAAILMGLAPMVAGLYLGNRVHLNISRTTLMKVIGALLTVSGASLIGKVLL